MGGSVYSTMKFEGNRRWKIETLLIKKRVVSNKEWRHTIQMTNDRPEYKLLLVNYNVYVIFYWTLYTVSITMRKKITLK